MEAIYPTNIETPQSPSAVDPSESILVLIRPGERPTTTDVCRLSPTTTVNDIRDALQRLPNYRIGRSDNRSLRARPVVLVGVPAGFAHPEGTVFATAWACASALGKGPSTVSSALVYAKAKGETTARIKVSTKTVPAMLEGATVVQTKDVHEYVLVQYVDAGASI